MEATLIIKMSDGTEKIIQLSNTNITLNLVGPASITNESLQNDTMLHLTANVKTNSLIQLL